MHNENAVRPWLNGAEESILFTELVNIPQDLIAKHLTQEAYNALKVVMEKLNTLVSWTKEAIHQALEQVTTELGIKLGFIAQPIRVAVTGTTVSPSIDVTLTLLGKEKKHLSA